MDKRDEKYLLDIIDDIADITIENNKLLKQNNKMLKEIIKVINYYLSHANEENENDFGRNVLANMLSNMLELTFLGTTSNK